MDGNLSILIKSNHFATKKVPVHGFKGSPLERETFEPVNGYFFCCKMIGFD